ncbi:hypothetical protein [Cellulomonas shaoxiangyii]|uniref:PH-like domain-containing protein n=1 Tax=Cellulomonas shaoxiangyii TaxID=2566013 RepID=UPI001AA08E98|nr:hypothetical protein [Cellulomonas shaoxiangyii]
MPAWLSVTLLLVVLVLALWGMRAGWRNRARRTALLVPALPTAPADPGAARTEPAEAVYVSSTRAGDWLDRVVAHDLGVRSPAQVQVHDAGVLVRRTGARDVWVPADRLTAVGTTRGQAGKFVGPDGLVVLTWVPDPTTGTALDTALRLRHEADKDPLLTAARALVRPGGGGTGADHDRAVPDSAPRPQEEQA